MEATPAKLSDAERILTVIGALQEKFKKGFGHKNGLTTMHSWTVCVNLWKYQSAFVEKNEALEWRKEVPDPIGENLARDHLSLLLDQQFIEEQEGGRVPCYYANGKPVKGPGIPRVKYIRARPELLQRMEDMFLAGVEEARRQFGTTT